MSAFWNKFKKEEKGKTEVKEPAVVTGDERKDEKQSVKSVKKNDSKGNGKGKKESGKKPKKIENYEEQAQLVNRTIIRPIISEDAMNKEVLAKYVFEVDKHSTKNEVAKAVKAKYGVTVEKVNIINHGPENHRFRQSKGQKKGFKKAIVTIKVGEKIELFAE